MIEFWRFNQHHLTIFMLLICLVGQKIGFCCSLNEKGEASLKEGNVDPCTWNGEGSSNKNVVILNSADAGNVHRRLLNIDSADPPHRRYRLRRQIISLLSLKSVKTTSSSQPQSSSPSPSPSPLPSPVPSPSPSPSPSVAQNPKVTPPNSLRPPPSSSYPEDIPGQPSKSPGPNKHLTITLPAALGGTALLLLLASGIYFCRSNKVSAVRPWATGLSGQLQKAFVTGVPSLKRTELEAACEDFSNVIVESAKEWPENLEAQFRKKIYQLSRVNHKNFVNLIGYCEEDKPFTRMVVFEYAPNGTLFEHLHIREAEHLDWGMRMRIVMGIAYCLEHLHQLKPPIAHKNLNSSAVNLTEDYAAKLSDFGLWNEIASKDMQASPESNVYSFGVLLFELVTGRLPYTVESFALEDWASDYLKGDQPLKEMVDQILTSFDAEQLEQIGEVIKSCCQYNPKQRPAMKNVTARLKEITRIRAEEAVPRLSPLWWAELEIISSEGL
ncbi:Inactive receptor-like protein kinase [Heracleum sosnowskyi]|uniref:Inactive receptor-like protein kinase n=1 Tax=Heracleum sosnowskyi TaxID=360622 RepID=A0AAD8M0J1_9APIA|nr:Inactive receptor-like protein kinase [Heracleum sosnowskyi]